MMPRITLRPETLTFSRSSTLFNDLLMHLKDIDKEITSRETLDSEDSHRIIARGRERQDKFCRALLASIVPNSDWIDDAEEGYHMPSVRKIVQVTGLDAFTLKDYGIVLTKGTIPSFLNDLGQHTRQFSKRNLSDKYYRSNFKRDTSSCGKAMAFTVAEVLEHFRIRGSLDQPARVVLNDDFKQFLMTEGELVRHDFLVFD